MATVTDSETGTTVHLEVHTADVEHSVAFSKLTLKLLFNLFDREHKRLIGEEIEELLRATVVGQADNQSVIQDSTLSKRGSSKRTNDIGLIMSVLRRERSTYKSKVTATLNQY